MAHSEINADATGYVIRGFDRVTQAFLPMKKFDIETLKRAYEGK